ASQAESVSGIKEFALMKRGSVLLSQFGPITQGPFPAPRFYLSYLSQLTLQKGMIPSFTLVVIGAAIAKQVQATATTRTKVLTARFMAFSLHAGPLGAETLSGWNYISTVKPVFLWR